jgi:hypothetical protein
LGVISVSAQIPSQVRHKIAKSKGKTIQIALDPFQSKQTKKYSTTEFLSKIDPVLLKPLFVDAEKGLAKTSNQDNRRAKKQTIRLFKSADGKEKVGVFIEIESGTGFQIPGFEVRRISPNGDIAIGYIERNQLTEAAKLNSVKRIQAARFNQLKKVAGIKSIKADIIHTATANFPNGVKGKDVIVGVLDSGIDFDLDVFGNSNGTRIQYLL